ncbi:hypothetical protein BH10ACT7_BH10ACT7_05940 [soil metagenome]
METMTRIAGINALNGRVQEFVGWGARAEDATSVAARLAATIVAVERIDGSSPASWVDAKSRLPLDQASLTEYVSDEVSRDESGAKTPAFGYSPRVYRPAESGLPTLEVKVTAGSGHARKAGIYVNSVFLSFLGDRQIALDYFSERGAELLHALVEAWQPDFGHAGAVPQMLATAPQGFGLPGSSAITWLSAQFVVPREVPGVEVREFAGGHTMYLGSADAADSSVEPAVEAHRYLVDHGLSPAAAVQP